MAPTARATFSSCTDASGISPRLRRALPPRAMTMRTSGSERRDHHGLDRVQPVLGLVEHDRVPGAEDVVGHLEGGHPGPLVDSLRSEEHTSELQSLMRIAYAVFCLKKKRTSIRVDSQQKLPHE